MNIGISAFAGDGGKSGISQYMVNILKRLPALDEQHRYTIYMTHADRDYLPCEHPRVRVVSYPNWVGKPVVNIFWHLLWLPIALALHRCQCVYLPAGNRRLAWFYGVPSVSTIHDLSQLHVPAKYDAARMFYIMRVLPKMMRRLDQVLSISHSTRRDLEDFAKIDPQRITVVYNGADLERFKPLDKTQARERVNAQTKIPGRYILYISRLEHPGKNHVRLIQAFAKLKAQHPELTQQLVLVGSRWNGAEAIDQAVQEHGLSEQVIFPGFLPNEVLPDLLSGADLFVFPSLFEGFGIPPLEAMMAGTPVVASNAASIPEVVGDAGLLFDPKDADAIADAIYQVLSDPSLAEQLIAKGLTQAQSFSWDEAAAGVLKLCEKAVQSKR